MGCHVISPGELAAGMHVTVIEHHPKDEPNGGATPPFEMMGAMGIMLNRHRSEPDWMGVLFEVLAVDIPFVLLRPLQGETGAKLMLDTRRYVFKELAKEFVHAAIGKDGPQPAAAEDGDPDDDSEKWRQLANAHNQLAKHVQLIERSLGEHLMGSRAELGSVPAAVLPQAAPARTFLGVPPMVAIGMLMAIVGLVFGCMSLFG